jgi:hypothetical protein
MLVSVKLTLPLLGACAVLLSGCGSAAVKGLPLDRRIALDHGIGVVTFGELKTRVDAALGSGKTTHKEQGGFLVIYPQAGLTVGYGSYRGKEHVFAILTQSPRYETASGVGVGTTLDELRKRVQVVCNGDGAFKDGVSTSPATDPRDCNHPLNQTNHPFTDFKIDAQTRRVSEVAIFPGGD